MNTKRNAALVIIVVCILSLTIAFSIYIGEMNSSDSSDFDLGDYTSEYYYNNYTNLIFDFPSNFYIASQDEIVDNFGDNSSSYGYLFYAEDEDDGSNVTIAYENVSDDSTYSPSEYMDDAILAFDSDSVTDYSVDEYTVVTIEGEGYIMTNLYGTLDDGSDIYYRFYVRRADDIMLSIICASSDSDELDELTDCIHSIDSDIAEDE